MARQDRRTRKQRSKRRPRIIIGTSAYLDTDPDLVAWWQSLPEGQGSEILRKMIRASLATSVTQDQEQIVALLHNLSRDVKAIGQQLKGAIVAGQEQHAPGVKLLTEEEAEAKLDNILANDW
jgi:hypothetical protein